MSMNQINSPTQAIRPAYKIIRDAAASAPTIIYASWIFHSFVVAAMDVDAGGGWKTVATDRRPTACCLFFSTDVLTGNKQ